jgi:hypothetical protein
MRTCCIAGPSSLSAAGGGPSVPGSGIPPNREVLVPEGERRARLASKCGRPTHARLREDPGQLAEKRGYFSQIGSGRGRAPSLLLVGIGVPMPCCAPRGAVQASAVIPSMSWRARPWK